MQYDTMSRRNIIVFDNSEIELSNSATCIRLAYLHFDFYNLRRYN